MLHEDLCPPPVCRISPKEDTCVGNCAPTLPLLGKRHPIAPLGGPSRPFTVDFTLTARRPVCAFVPLSSKRSWPREMSVHGASKEAGRFLLWPQVIPKCSLLLPKLACIPASEALPLTSFGSQLPAEKWSPKMGLEEGACN